MNLEQLARAKWRSSGLTDKDAKRLKLSTIPKEEMSQLGFIAAGALKIPYWTPCGKPSKFYRVRYLEELPGFRADATKPMRYAQPKGTLCEVYLPPLFNRYWEAILNDPSTPLYITEGELKAAAGCAAGLATLGLGGVDSWRSSKRGIELLPTLKETEWEGRDVTIVYDSDAATNPNVVRASNRLAEALVSLGAKPSIASLPGGPKGEKVGLDDFLEAKGAEALAEVLKDAPMFPEAKALWELNREVCYIRNPGLVIERATGNQMTPANFVSHVYANRHHQEVKLSKDGERGTPVTKPTAPKWLEWERRFELSAITYKPGASAIVDNQWNTWKGWGCVPKKGDVGPWKWLLDFLFRSDPDPEARRWFERWLAYPLQHPGTKLFTSAVMWGIVHGTGKTLVGHSMLQIYGANGTEIKDRDLRDGFNEWARDKQFVVGDEVTGSDKREQADRLKGLITQPALRINVKYLPSYVVPDCVNYFFTSNHPDAFFMEDSDRRMFIHEVKGAPAPQAKYDAYDRWLYKEGGAAALFDYLLKLPLGDFNPKAAAYTTAAKRAMITDNKSDLGAWCLSLREEPERVLSLLGDRAAKGAALFSPLQLLRAYDPEGATKVTANGVGRELKRTGFPRVNGDKPVRTPSAGLMRLYALRDAEKWEKAGHKAIVDHWESYFGPKAKKF